MQGKKERQKGACLHELILILQREGRPGSSLFYLPNMVAREKEAWWVSFVAGNAGGIFGLFSVFPLDTVKIRLQTRGASVCVDFFVFA